MARSADPKALRRNATEAEKRLWSILRAHRLEGFKFKRQQPLGPYVVDFCCWSRRLVVEVDGGQHADSAADQRRTLWLNGQGWHVIGFWNNEVLGNIEGVRDTILSTLDARPPLPAGEGRGEGLGDDA